MNIVELELDETLADFEIQDWIDNVFSVQYPDIKATLKHECSGLCKKESWKYPSKGELPECDENKKLWLYFKDYYANDRDCEHPIYLTSTGVYKTSFLNEGVKLFAEKSKGYESEILPKDIIAWMYLPEPPKEAK